MSRRVRRADAFQALTDTIIAEIKAVAGNIWVSREESPGLDPLYRRVEAKLRAEGGPGTRVHVDTLSACSIVEVIGVWIRVDPPLPGLDGALLSKHEIKQIIARDPEVGALLSRVAEKVRSGGTWPAKSLSESSITALQGYFSDLDLSEGGFGRVVPGAERIDARVGSVGRRGIPSAVLVGFDWYYRAEAHDWASCGLWRVTVAGVDLYAICTSTDGDDGWLETYALDGSPAVCGRFYGFRLLAWDEFFGRARLSAALLVANGYKRQEGLSEEEDRVAAGQPSRAWTGDLTVSSGTIHALGMKMGTVTLDVDPTEAQRDIIWATFDLLWDRGLRQRVDRSGKLDLGLPRGEGNLTVGDFTRPTDGKTFEVAWWRDIDDGSFVFYFSRDALGLHLVIEQFDN